MQSLLLLPLLLVGLHLAWSSPLQIINTYGQLNSDFTISKFVKSQAVNTQKSLKTLSVLDCTGAGDNKFINTLLGTSFKGVNGTIIAPLYTFPVSQFHNYLLVAT